MILEIKTEATYEEVVEKLSRNICPSELGYKQDACHREEGSPVLCIDCWKGALKEVAE